MNTLTPIIAQRLGLGQEQVDNTLALLDAGCTIPFIARYRKERTGNLNEVQIAQISELYEKLQELEKRKETILKTIGEQGALTPELESRIRQCYVSSELEDLYLPYKPKRRTRAQVAREQGLEPLAVLLKAQRERDPWQRAEAFVNDQVADAEAAIQGAQDIIAEEISEDARSRQTVRTAFERGAMIRSKVVKAKADSDEAAKYSDYFDFEEPLRRCSSHRLLAMRRGEKEGILRVTISPDDEQCAERLIRQHVRSSNECGQLVEDAVIDAYKRLIKPSIETEFANSSKTQADEQAIDVFAGNLRQLLLAAPLGPKRVMGIDPGFRTGCKVVCLDAQGNLLHHEAIFPHPPVNHRMQATVHVQQMVKDYDIEAIAIGNGTASRETSDFIKDLGLPKEVRVFTVSEDGASVYSASQTARDEFPDEDVTVRGAVSIGRRYQHDVDQGKLKKSLDQTVESCVNSVGVNLNTASQHLLTYVSGLGPALAKNIVAYRRQNGAFTSRAQLKKVPRLGPSAYEQCAGFLRIPGAKNPLDNSAVHPESYPIVAQMAKDSGCTVDQLIADKEKRSHIDIKRYVTASVGLPTLTDIMSELEKPGRDPREQIEEFEFDPNVTSVDDLEEGMILPGIVTNITNFGAFVDIGVHQDGLVHISQLANRYVKDANEVVKLHQHVRVMVKEVDHRRGRISLTMRF